MRFLYVLLFVPFTAAIPLPSTHLAITGLNARAMDGPGDTLGGPHVPTVTFGEKFKPIRPETRDTHIAYALNHHAALDNNDPLKNAPYINWGNPSRFYYHTRVPKKRNRIGGPHFKPPIMSRSSTLPEWNTGGIEAKVHAEYAALPVDHKQKVATNAHVFRGWHYKDAADVAAGRERAAVQYYRGGPPGWGGKRVGEPTEVFRDASERFRPPASGPQPQWAQL